MTDASDQNDTTSDAETTDAPTSGSARSRSRSRARTSDQAATDRPRRQRSRRAPSADAGTTDAAADAADAPATDAVPAAGETSSDGPARKSTRKSTKKSAKTSTRRRASSAADADDQGKGAATDGEDTTSDKAERPAKKRASSSKGRSSTVESSSDGDASVDDTAPTGDDEGTDDDTPKGDDKKSGDGKKSDGKKPGGKKKGGKKTEGKKKGDKKGKGDKKDDKVAEAIATGGTRMAAKNSRRGGGGSGGGGRGRGNQRPSGISEEERRMVLASPPKTMLVTSNDERTQIAVLEDRHAVEHYVTRKKDVTFVGNIYMGRVQNVLPGMEAAFVDIGKGRNGVLYAGEVLYDELDLEEGETARIEDALKPGQSVLVQVTKDPMGTKGPRLTMHLSLAGRYMVLAPNSDVFGISRKLTDRERDRLRTLVKNVKPDHHGIIVRTAAAEASDEALTRDLTRLLEKWEKAEEKAKDAKALDVVYEEPPLVVKVIRDNFGPDFLNCIVDAKDLYDQVIEYLDEVAPELKEKVHLFTPAPVEGDKKPESLFAAYKIVDQLRKATDRKVGLPSGGYLIIERTEAMKVIDVNTGKFTGDKGSNLEEVVLKTNLEAAEEIVRQLRLRDIGGIIVIDFIDMLLKANQKAVVDKLKRELHRDRTKTRVSDVSRLGLVQMTRKNVSHGLLDAFSEKCSHCNGRGFCVHDDKLG